MDFYIVDMRPEWSRNPYVTVWRPDNAGYAYPLPWAGKYDKASVDSRPSYYFQHGLTNSGKKRKEPIRFPVPCDVVEALSIPKPAPRMVDGDVGPVLVNNAKTRAALRASMYRPAKVEDAANV